MPGLDLLRAVAISWVMLYHGSLYGLSSGDNWLVRFGWMGVDLFFVLSGFLIASQLLRPWARGSRPDYGRFFMRRLFRTIPAYLAVVAIYFLIPAARDRDHVQPLWAFLTFTQNLTIDPGTPNAFSHAWSLCVEEQFYLIFPLVVALLGIRPSATKTIGAMIAVAVLGMALRGWFWLHDVAQTPFDVMAHPKWLNYMRLIYYPTWTRLDGLLSGVAAAAVMTFRPAWWRSITLRPNVLLVSGLLGIGAATLLFRGQIAGFYAAVLGFPLLSVSMAALVLAGSSPSSVIGSRAIPGAGALAAASYSLYLSHKMVYHAVSTRLGAALPSGWALPVAILAALFVGATLYALVERPLLRLRDRIGSRAPSSLATQAVA